MSKQSSWKRILIGGAAAVAVVVGTAVFTLTPATVSAQDAAPETASVEDGGRGFGWRGHGGPRGMMDHGFKGADHSEYLAAALNISAEDLEAAKAEAHTTAVEQLVDAGVITQEQADAMGQRAGRLGMHGFRGRGAFGPGNDVVDHDALLAETLDIDVETLLAAKEEARQAGLDAAIDAGELTEEEAEHLQAMHALRDYIDHEQILAGALGVTVEELQSAHENGTVRDLFEASGLDRDGIKEAMQAGFEAAVEQALGQGAITPEQADALRSGEGFGGRGLFPGRGGHGFSGRGPGGFERGGSESSAPRVPAQQSRA